MLNVSKIFSPCILVFALSAISIPGCSDPKQVALEDSAAENSSSSRRDKVVLLLNWYPEAEHGGFYAAKVHGLYEAQNLDVEIRAGGKTTVVPQELTLGRIQFGVANADDVVLAREQSAPLVALMAPLQIGPRCIMVREDSGISSFEELENITLQIRALQSIKRLIGSTLAFHWARPIWKLLYGLPINSSVIRLAIRLSISAMELFEAGL